MTIEQTVEIPDSRRVFFDLPPQIPAGKARIAISLLDYQKPGTIEAFTNEEEATEFATRLSKKMFQSTCQTS
ncbi:MAG: hypothetical protein LBL64_01315 [Treponema sp.]|jgi:hypothetical protein|nr:hypothetical protein [Treponema sp.]